MYANTCEVLSHAVMTDYDNKLCLNQESTQTKQQGDSLTGS